MSTVIGLIEDRAEAEAVVNDLVHEGFARDHIRVMASDQHVEREKAESPASESGLRLVLEKLGLLQSRRREIGLSSEEEGYFSEGVRRGGLLVTVETDEPRANQAADILEHHGAVDIEERATQWRQAGWTPGQDSGTPTAGAPPTGTAPTSAQAPGAGQAIPIVEEELKVGKRAVRRGGVRIYSRMVEEPVSESVRLREEHVDVQRRPVDRPATEADLAAFKEGSIEMVETAEEPVVAKEARVVEEVAVSKGVEERTQTVGDTVRRTQVEVENLGAGTGGPAASFDDWESDFRRHHAAQFTDPGAQFDTASPAYRLGFSLGKDPNSAQQDWAAVEPAARRRWDTDHPGTWERMSKAIRYGWEKAKGSR